MAYLLKASPKDGPAAGIVYADGARGPAGAVRNPSWSPDGKSVVYYRFGVTNRAHTRACTVGIRVASTVIRTCSPPCVASRPDLRSRIWTFRSATHRLPQCDEHRRLGPPEDLPATGWCVAGAHLVPDCQWIAFGFGTFFGGRGFAPANVFMVKADGSENKQVTHSKVNAGFPAWHPDGKTIIYRVWGTADSPETRGLRALDLPSGKITVLTTEWDNFPFISPSGDRVVFTRRMPDFDFEIFSMKPDGSDVKRLTTSRGADAHATWSRTARRSGSKARARALRTRRRCTTPPRSHMPRSSS